MTLDATGFTPLTLDQIKTAMEVSFRDAFGAGTKLTADTKFGKLIGILAEREDNINQKEQALYDSFNPITASNVSLDRVAAITGITRNPALASTVTLYLAGLNATAIPIGSLVQVDDAEDQFKTLAAVTMSVTDDFTIASSGSTAITGIVQAAGTATVTTTAPHGLPTGAIVTVSGAGEAGYNITAVMTSTGASTFTYAVDAGTASPATGTLVFVDEGLAQDPGGTVVTVRSVAHGLSASDIRVIQSANETDYNRVYTVVASLDADHFTVDPGSSFSATPATGSYEGKTANAVAAESVQLDAIQGLAQTLNVIVNAISGWQSVANLVDATVGNLAETDAAFRIRRQAALQGQGNATLTAIRGDLLSVSGVTTALVFENVTDVTVGIRPPRSIEAVVEGGVNQDILDALFESKAGGIQTVGTVSGSVTDSQGTSHTVSFSRATIKDVWIEIDVTTNADYPADGDDQVKAALVAEGALLGIGDDVIPRPDLVGSISDIPGIIDVDIGVLITALGGPDPSPTPGTDNGPITIAETEKADFDTSRITVL